MLYLMMCVRHGSCMPRRFYELITLTLVMVSVKFSGYRSIPHNLMSAVRGCLIVHEYECVKKLSACLYNEINVILSPADSYRCDILKFQN
jgi:hypothetical protein